MTSENFAACLSLVLHEEGGFTDNRKDPGNWTGGKVGKGQLKGTKYGIAASSHPALDIRNLTLDQAGAIYRAEYWSRAGCDTLAPGVDLAIFDPSVNQGVGRGIRYRNDTASIAAPVARVRAIGAKRRAFYQGLATFKTFGKGWLARVARVEAAGTRMALEASGHAPAAVTGALASAGGHADAKAGAAKAKAKAAAAGGAGSPVAFTQMPDVSGFPHLGAALAFLMAAAAIAAIVILVQRSRAHAAVSTAFASEALRPQA